MKHTFEISIEAASQQDAVIKLQAASILMERLKPKEIMKLADVVKNDPVKSSLAKKALGL